MRDVYNFQGNRYSRVSASGAHLFPFTEFIYSFRRIEGSDPRHLVHKCRGLITTLTDLFGAPMSLDSSSKARRGCQIRPNSGLAP